MESRSDSANSRRNDQEPDTRETEMRKAIKDLCRIPDDSLLEEVAKGIQCVLDNAESLAATAVRLDENGEHRSAAILDSLATEESAKVVILIDLVRCPSGNQDGKLRTARAFANHLAKEIYAMSCDWRMGSFAEFADAVNLMRRQFYLAGPNDVDWIVTDHGLREGRMYADYIQDITVKNGNYYWISPLDMSFDKGFGVRAPTPLLVGRALERAGITSTEGLGVVAELWRSFEPNSRTGSHELFELKQQTLALAAANRPDQSLDQEDARMIFDYWAFPMWPLDLTPSKELSVDDLRRHRAEQIKWFTKRNAERNPQPVITRSKLAGLFQGHDDSTSKPVRQVEAQRRCEEKAEEKALQGGSTPEDDDQLKRRVLDLSYDEIIDLTALGLFGARREMGWVECREQAQDIHSSVDRFGSRIDWVCSYRRYWVRGLDRWEQPPAVPKSLTIGAGEKSEHGS